MRSFGVRRLAAALAGVAAVVAGGHASAACRLALVAELPVVMDGNQPLVRGSINGKPMLALADTGAFSSLVWRGAAEPYGLPVRPLRGLIISGVGGSREAQATSVKELKLGDQARRNINLLMGGWNRPMGRSEIAMILGQDILSHSDVEFDLANNMIRFVRPVGCGPKDSLAYWGGSYAESPIEAVSKEAPHIITTVEVNGRRMRAMLDTGAWTSVINTPAAVRAGVRPGSTKAPESGRAGGVGRRSVATYVGAFDSFQIGEQLVKNAKLRIAELFRTRAGTGSRLASSAGDEADMLIGADFLRSHRVLVSYSQRRMVFSHTGGPIFQTVGDPMDADPAPEGAEAAAVKPAAGPQTAAEPVIARPRWEGKPDGAVLERLYPAGAKQAGVSGRATVACVVTAAGAMSACEIVSEEPAGAGFGAATLALAPHFRMSPTTAEGRSVEGGRVRIPVVWRTSP